MTAIPLLEVQDLTVEFSTRRGVVRAVEHVNLSIAKGETVGIVGVGAIAEGLAPRCKAFGMRVVGWSRSGVPAAGAVVPVTITRR